MGPSKWTQEETIIAAAESEWPIRTPDALVAFSFDVDPNDKIVRLRAHIDGALSEEEMEDMWDVEGGVITHLAEGWQTRFDIETVPLDQSPQLLPGGVIYRRGDQQTPHQRWAALPSPKAD